MKYLISGYGNMEAIGRQIAEGTGLEVKYDPAVVLYQKFIDAIKNGKKKHTMKFHQNNGKDIIRLPAMESLPLKLKTPTEEAKVGEVCFDYVEVKRWNEVAVEDAKDDGFANKLDFVLETEKLARERGFNLIYDSRVSFYHIQSVIWV